MKEIFGLFLFLTLFSFLLLLVLETQPTDIHRGRLKRNIRIAAFFLLLITMTLYALESRADDQSAPKLPEAYVTVWPTRAETILLRVAQADKLCNTQELSFVTEEGKATNEVEEKKKGKHKKRYVVSRVNKIVARPVYLCALKESDQTWHVVKVFVKYPVPKTFVKFPAWVATEGYEIEHVRGRGVARLTFNLTHHGEKLIVYRYRHAWFTKDPKKYSAHEIIRTARATNYTPYHADFNDVELRDIGANFLRNELSHAFEELQRAHVASRAFPGKLVSEVIHPKQPMILAAIEQTDDAQFVANSEDAINAIFIEYALNKAEAFNWSVSSANAIGALQFTNKNGNGTYDLVVRTYADASLDPDFESGTRDLRNILKAAICLLDYELGNLPDVQGLYQKNPKIGGIYPVAAYNEGGGGARQMYQLITRNNVDLEQDDVELPQGVFQRIRKALTFSKKKRAPMRKVLNHETYFYIKKYMFVWNYLDTIPLTPVAGK